MSDTSGSFVVQELTGKSRAGSVLVVLEVLHKCPSHTELELRLYCDLQTL